MIVTVKGQRRTDWHYVNPAMVTHLTPAGNGTDIHLVGGTTLHVEVEVNSAIYQLSEKPKATAEQLRAASNVIGMNE